jgi:hypothetical protein
MEIELLAHVCQHREWQVQQTTMATGTADLLIAFAPAIPSYPLPVLSHCCRLPFGALKRLHTSHLAHKSRQSTHATRSPGMRCGVST